VKLWPVLAVALGGALGTLGRIGADLAMVGLPGGHEWATLGVNLLGSFGLGLVTGHGLPRMSSALREGLTIGVLGSYTTMSGVAIIALALPTLGIAYVLVTLALGLASAWLGYIWGRQLPASGRTA
jgi:fluoride exporter